MRTYRLYLGSVSLILVLCCLSLPVYAQSGGSADSYVRAYESGLEMLASTPLTNGERLEDIRKLFEQSDTYALGAEYLSYVNALIVLQTGNANRYDEALESIRRLQKNAKFSNDYNSRLDQSNRPALTDLEQYIKARKLEAFGDTQGALTLYDAYPVLDAVTRANLLSISLKLGKYDEATSLLLKGTLESLQQAAVIYEELGDFRDSPKRLQECREKMEALATPMPIVTPRSTPSPEPTVQPPASLSISVSSVIVTLRWNSVSGADEYRIYRAESSQGSMKLLITLQGTEYKDTGVTAGHTYNYQVAAVKGSRESALSAPAQAVMPNPTQKPTTKLTSTLKPTPTTKMPKVGDTITYGRYEQDNNITNGKEEIAWRVLKVDGDRVLLISEKNLDAQPYNKTYTSVTWETCFLRVWLNGVFLNTAFTRVEQEAILSTALKNEDNPDYGTDGGQDTRDKVFLLSVVDAENFFSGDKERVAKNTAYAKMQGAFTSDSGGSWWWLRSPGGYQSYAAYVIASGFVYRGGIFVYDGRNAVRPAIWLDLSSL